MNNFWEEKQFWNSFYGNIGLDSLLQQWIISVLLSVRWMQWEQWWNASMDKHLHFIWSGMLCHMQMTEDQVFEGV